MQQEADTHTKKHQTDHVFEHKKHARDFMQLHAWK